MKYLLSILFISSILISCGSSDTNNTGNDSSDTTTQTKVIHLTPQEFQAKMVELDNEQLVDVRTSGEVANGYIANSTNIDFKSNDFGDKVASLNKEQPVMVYCASGGRSKRACNSMKDWGFTTIYELDNGFGSWESAGMPVAK